MIGISSDHSYGLTTLPGFVKNTTREGDILDKNNDNDRAIFSCGKYYVPSTDYIPGRMQWASNKNWPVIRYAEILLMHAEALPRVELQNYSSLQMGKTANPSLDGKEVEHTGLMVYNVNTEQCKPTSGVHVWDGSKWQPLNAETSNSTVAPGPATVYAPNTYIGTGKASITIPVEKAFAIWDWWGSGNHPEEGKLLPETSANFTGSLSVKVIWEEDEAGNSNVDAGGIVVGTPTLDKTALDRTAKITVPITGRLGNAVIALSDGTGVRWSWHIWVPNSDPAAITYTHNNGEENYTFMDRNLRATRNGVLVADRPYTMGAHYQWGRKDPFPGYLKLNGSMAPNKVPSNVPIVPKAITDVQTTVDGKTSTLTHAVQNPLDLIGYATTSWDWYTTRLGGVFWDSRWGDALDPCNKDYRYTYKSEMDSCPEGWRVPSYSGHSKLVLSGSGDVYEPKSPFSKNGVTSVLKDNYTDQTLDLGYDFSKEGYSLGWFPASGYRADSQGNAVLYPDVVSHPVLGHYWTSSHPYNAYSSPFLQMQTDAIRPWQDTGRAQAQSVRCVKE